MLRTLIVTHFELVCIVGALLGLLLVWISGLVRYIPHTRIGVAEKLVSLAGSVKSGFIALRGEAGFQPKVLRGGWHAFAPFQYRVHRLPLVTIPQGKIGYVFARDGQPLPTTQTLASNSRTRSFEDVVAFLREGGQRGPQRAILREGTYAINLAQFVVITEDQVLGLAMDKHEEGIFRQMAELIADREGFTPVVITEDLVGIVTAHDGAALQAGEIIAPAVGDSPETAHNNFQDPERFLAAGGRRGRQLQVLVEGTYYINRLFATVETIPKTVVDVGHVGVVVSYTGNMGPDLSGTEYKHGEMVAQGNRGVWSTALLPGKYAFNTYAGKVILVPTTNFILKWISNQMGSHHYDENLAEVSLITKDAFEPSLPLSVVLHIDYRKAPLVIQRFGDIKKLVEQTLDPMVAAFFKNIGQTKTLIELIQDRSEIQRVALAEMQQKFAHYNLELEEVLIGTPSAGGDKRIESILDQLRLRQIADEQVATYSRQEKAAVKERELREVEARARQQQQLTESEISINIQSNCGKAEYQRALQQAAQVRAMADAEADKVRALANAEAARIQLTGAAEADRSARVGVAQAVAIEEQVRSYGGPHFQVLRDTVCKLAEAVEKSGVDVVPRVVMGGGNGHGGNGSMLESLFALLLSEKLGVTLDERAPDPAAVALREHVRQTLLKDKAGGGGGAA
jgi:uncharacterized membrane protein YqiK